eukprot:gene9034-16677_t
MPYEVTGCEPFCEEEPPIDGRSYATAFQIAVDDVNRNSSLLPNHEIKFVFNDSTVDEANALMAVYKQLNGMNVSALVGLGWFCHSVSTIATAVDVPVISHYCKEDDSIMVHKKSEDKLLFARTYPLTTQIVPTIVAILNRFKWKKIAIMKNEELNALQMSGNLRISDQFREFGIDIEIEKALPETIDFTRTNRADLRNAMKAVKDKCVRVIVFMCVYKIAREALVFANELNMTGGNFVFIIIIRSPVEFEDKIARPFKWFMSEYGEHSVSSENGVKEALKTAFLVGPTINDNERYKRFVARLKRDSSNAPFYSNFFDEHRYASIPEIGYYLYDTVLLYALAANKSLMANGNVNNGTAIYNSLKGMTYESILGHEMVVHELSHRGLYVKFNYMLYTFNESSVVTYNAYFVESDDDASNKTTLVYKERKPLNWPKSIVGDLKCESFFNEDYTKVLAISISVSIIVVMLVLLPVFKYRSYRLERSLTNKLWEVDISELMLHNGTFTQAISTPSVSIEKDIPLSPVRKKSSIETVRAIYKTDWVAVKIIEAHNIELKRESLLELKQIREIRHDNINPFIGAHVKPGRVLIVTQIAAHGSLEDVLENDNMKLETLFLLSLISDITKGMAYLHNSPILSHGSLKSSNCLIDSNWLVKITDFGLHTLKRKTKGLEYNKLLDSRSHLWVAPELLRDPNPPARGSAKGDVYSFGVILQECHTRRGPWSDVDLSCEEIVARVVKAENPPFRPIVPNSIENAPELQTMMCRCWSENPQDRPSFSEMAKETEAAMKGNGFKSNIVDDLLYRIEQYAKNWEHLVEQKNKELSEEKKRIEALVGRMLPRAVYKQLTKGKEVEAETFREVTIYFSDIVGFTSLCAASTAMEVVTFLNQLYTLFDSIIKYYNVYKVETIGDAYMVVSGLPVRNGNEHAKEIALMAFHILNAVKTFVIQHQKDSQLRIRIGINSGSVVTGVVGSTMPRYCLFGDTVNTASRMESTGEALKIHVSESTKEILTDIGGFELQTRGEIAVKGKGVITTYWLNDINDKYKNIILKHELLLSEAMRDKGTGSNTPVPSTHKRNPRATPQGSLCPSPNTSPTLFRKGSRYRARVEPPSDLPSLDVSHRLLTLKTSKNTPTDESEHGLPNVARAKTFTRRRFLTTSVFGALEQDACLCLCFEQLEKIRNGTSDKGTV